MRLRTLWPAALVTAAVAAPVGIALAATGPAPAPTVVSSSLRASLGGHATAAGAMRDAGRGRIAREHLRLARRYDALTGRHTARRAERRALRLSPHRLRALNRALRADVRELDVPVPAVLAQVAECESHGDPKAIGGGGTFRGRYQFMRSTWASVGGHGDPAAAPAKEQDRRAAILLARSGSSPWPVCGA
jgi:Transglycosylase-like domain